MEKIKCRRDKGIVKRWRYFISSACLEDISWKIDMKIKNWDKKLIVLNSYVNENFKNLDLIKTLS